MNIGQSPPGPLGKLVRIAALAAISAGLFALFWSTVDPVNNEFFNLYAGAKIGPHSLYDPHGFTQVARSLHARVEEARLYYTRMPYFAVLTKPLAWLEFPVALAIWRAT
ncbi:MAG: hypothetical protein LAP40_12690 [Acidobacteriia bacterium]|nr:hypothetical protein [Terriglobia bacterium]